MSYLILDYETQNHKVRGRVANPFYKENFIVMSGWIYKGQTFSRYTKTKAERIALVDSIDIPDDCTLLVGHNIKFDLLHTWKEPGLQSFLERGGMIWDTQYAEYLLKGHQQSVQMVSLNDTAPKYGGSVKIDEVKALWEEGILTADIDEDLLRRYLCGVQDENGRYIDKQFGDLGNTQQVFLGQMQLCAKLEMGKMIMARMDGLLATTMMEANGIKVDCGIAAVRLSFLVEELAAVTENLQTFLPTFPKDLEFNWGSGTHVSCLLYGGTIKYESRLGYLDDKGEPARLKATADWPLYAGVATKPGSEMTRVADQDRFKSGKRKGEFKFKKVPVPGELKLKWQDQFFKLAGFTVGRAEWRMKLTDGKGKPLYATDSDTLGIIARTTDVPFCKALENRAALNKEISVYYITTDKQGNPKGMLTAVDPETKIIHHNLNHTSTVTTRLAASKPNMQNIPRKDKSEVKKMFVSRFGEDGVMIEGDYSQLEIVCQGVLSKDAQLCQDLRDKIDFHCKRVSLKEGCTYEEALYRCKDETYEKHDEWKAIRTSAKIFSFQRAYGAGAELISDETGIPVEDVKAMIEIEDATYPGIVAFNRDVEAEVWRTAENWWFTDHSRGFRKFQYGSHTAPTGTRYVWRTYDAPAWLQKRGKEKTFSPTELKNYPVQGFGGEVVQTITGLLFRHFIANGNYGGKAVLINTVHDCVWIDCHKDIAALVGRDVKRIMESVPQYFNERYGMKITVPFPVDMEVGPDMHTMHHLEIAA